MLYRKFCLWFYCERQKFNLTGVFIFLFMVTGRGIKFICSASVGETSSKTQKNIMRQFTMIALKITKMTLESAIRSERDDVSFERHLLKSHIQQQQNGQSLLIWVEVEYYMYGRI